MTTDIEDELTKQVEDGDFVRERGAVKKPVSVNGETINVDVQFAPLIKTLNEAGYRTRSCCSGMSAEHDQERHSNLYGYVQISNEISEEKRGEIKEAAEEAELAYYDGPGDTLMVNDQQLQDGTFVQHDGREQTARKQARAEARSDLGYTRDDLQTLKTLETNFRELVMEWEQRDDQLDDATAAMAERNREGGPPDKGDFIRKHKEDDRIYSRLKHHTKRLAEHSDRIDDPQQFLNELIEKTARAAERFDRFRGRMHEIEGQLIDEAGGMIDEQQRQKRWKAFLQALIDSE